MHRSDEGMRVRPPRWDLCPYKKKKGPEPALLGLGTGRGHVNTQRDGVCLQAKRRGLGMQFALQHLDLDRPSLQNGGQ